MRWITNTYDPTADDWADRIRSEYGQSKEDVVASYRKMLVGTTIGLPKAADVEGALTVEQLQANNIVGVYVPDDDPRQPPVIGIRIGTQ